MMDCFRVENDNTTRIMIGGYDVSTDGEFRVYTAMAPPIHNGIFDKPSLNCVKEVPNLVLCRKASTENEVGYGPGFVQRLRARFSPASTHERTPNAANAVHSRHKRFPSAGDAFSRAKVFAAAPASQNNSETRWPTSDLTASSAFTQSLAGSKFTHGRKQLKPEAKNFSKIVTCDFTLSDENANLSANTWPNTHQESLVQADTIESIRPPAEIKNISARVAEYCQNSAPRPWKADSAKAADATSATPRFSALREKFEQISRTNIAKNFSLHGSGPRNWGRSRSTHFDDIPPTYSTYDNESTGKFIQSLKRRSRSTTDYCTPAYSPPSDPKPGRLMKASFAYVFDDSTVSVGGQRRLGDSSPPPDEPLPTVRMAKPYFADEVKPRIEINSPKTEAIRSGVNDTTLSSTVTRPSGMVNSEEKIERNTVNRSVLSRIKVSKTPAVAECLSEVRHFLDRFNDRWQQRDSVNISPPPRKFSPAPAPDYRMHLRTRCHSTESKLMPNEVTKMSSLTEANNQTTAVTIDLTLHSETSSISPAYNIDNASLTEKLGDSDNNNVFINRSDNSGIKMNDPSADKLKTSNQHSRPIADHTTVTTKEIMKTEEVEMTMMKPSIQVQKTDKPDKPRNSFSSAYFDKERQSASEDRQVADVKVFQMDNHSLGGIRDIRAAAEANSFKRKEQKCPTNKMMIKRRKDVNCAAEIIKIYNSLHTAVGGSADLCEVFEAQFDQNDFKKADKIDKSTENENNNNNEIVDNYNERFEETTAITARNVQEISQKIIEPVNNKVEKSDAEIPFEPESASPIQPQLQVIRLNGSNDYDLIVDFEGTIVCKIDSDCNNNEYLCVDNNLIAKGDDVQQNSSALNPVAERHNVKDSDNLTTIQANVKSFGNYEKIVEESDEHRTENNSYDEDDDGSVKAEIDDEPKPTKEDMMPLSVEKKTEFVVEVGVSQTSKISDTKEKDKENDESNEDEDWNAAENPFAAALADARNFACDGEVRLFDNVDLDRAASPPSEAPHVATAEKFSLLASDGGPVRHSLLSLVMDEDIPHLLEAMAEEYNFTFEDYWTMATSTSSIIAKRVNDGTADRKRKNSQTRISFEEAPPRVFAYLDEASAVAEQESGWPDARTISFDEYQQIVQSAEDALVQQQIELAAWQSQVHTSSCSGASTSCTISSVLSESISRISMTVGMNPFDNKDADTNLAAANNEAFESSQTLLPA